jgi:hypothetical protein
VWFVSFRPVLDILVEQGADFCTRLLRHIANKPGFVQKYSTKINGMYTA